MSRTSRAEVRALRSQIREWRRGRANTTLYEQLSEAYIWVFTIVVGGAMAISVMIQTRVSIAAGCTAPSCEEARTSLVWAFGVGVVAVALATARAIGPVMVTPATGAWLLSAPVDRASLLQPRLLVATSVAALACGSIVAVVSLLAGFPSKAIAVLGVAAALAGVGATAAAARWQSREGRRTRRAGLVLGALTAAWLLLIALDRTPSTNPGWVLGRAGWIMPAALAISAIVLLARAATRISGLLRSQLVPGGSLLSSLSGALAGLDPALAYDVLVARRWLNVATVRPVRGGPSGAWAFVWRDIIRLRRSAGAVVAVVASLLVPYVVVSLGLDDIAVLASALAASATGIWLGTALRTTGRGSALVRCFPQSLAVVRSAALVVPGVVLFIWSIAAAPAIGRAFDDTSVAVTLLVAASTGMAALGAMARWLLAGPPNYSQPLVSSPAGAIPISLIGSLLRGFEVLILLTIPLLVAPNVTGSLVSLALTASVLAFLVRRR